MFENIRAGKSYENYISSTLIASCASCPILTVLNLMTVIFNIYTLKGR